MTTTAPQERVGLTSPGSATRAGSFDALDRSADAGRKAAVLEIRDEKR